MRTRLFIISFLIVGVICLQPITVHAGVYQGTVSNPVGLADSGELGSQTGQASFHALGRSWVFWTEDAYLVAGLPAPCGTCLAFASSRDGQSWAAIVTNLLTSESGDFAVTTNGTYVFVAIGGRSNLTFIDGALLANGSITWGISQLVKNHTWPTAPNILVTGSNQVFIGFTNNATEADFAEIIHSAGTDYSTWVGESINYLCDSDGGGGCTVLLSNVFGGQVCAVYLDSGSVTDSGIFGNFYNNGVWGPLETISPVGSHGPVLVNYLGNNVNGKITVFFLDDDNNPVQFMRAVRDQGGNWNTTLIPFFNKPGIFDFFSTFSYDFLSNSYYMIYRNGDILQVYNLPSQDTLFRLIATITVAPIIINNGFGLLSDHTSYPSLNDSSKSELEVFSGVQSLTITTTIVPGGCRGAGVCPPGNGGR